MILKRLILLVFVVFSAYSTAAGKIYKTVDENGKVTFSQRPPQDEGVEAEVEEINVGSEAMTRLTEEYGSQYCGGIKLPVRSGKYGSSTGTHARTIEKSLEGWRKSLVQTGKSVERRNQSSLKRRSSYSNSYGSQYSSQQEEQQTRDIQKMRDLRCAINWAEGKSNLIKEHKLTSGKERERLATIYNNLEQELLTTCGEQPEYDPSDSGNEYKRKRWYQCSRTFRNDMKKIDQRMGRLR